MPRTIPKITVEILAWDDAFAYTRVWQGRWRVRRLFRIRTLLLLVRPLCPLCFPLALQLTDVSYRPSIGTTTVVWLGGIRIGP